jgi:hypothetical protein
MALIELDALDRSFEAPCHNWVDVAAHALGTLDPRDRVIPGDANPHWIRAIRRYLNSADAVLLIDNTGNGVSASTVHALRARGTIADVDGFQLYRGAGSPSTATGSRR